MQLMGGIQTPKVLNPYAASTARNTADPIASAIKTNAQSAVTAASKVAAPNPYISQTAKNTTQYPSFAPGGTYNPSTASTDPVVQKIQASQAAAAAPPAGSTGATPGSGAYDLSTDPAVQAQIAANNAAYANKVAADQATAKQTLIDAGFNLSDLLAAYPSIAGSPIGSVLSDATTGQAAAGNPYSTAAQLAKTHTQNNNTINSNENDANLYYSSDRANQLANEVGNYDQGVASAKSSLAAALSGLIGDIATEKQNENTAYANAINTARENAITNAIASGQVLVGYDSNGNPIFNTVTSVTPAVGANDQVPGGSLSDFTNPDITSGMTPTLLQAGVSRPGANGIYPSTSALPVAIRATANKTGASGNKTQGIFSIH